MLYILLIEVEPQRMIFFTLKLSSFVFKILPYPNRVIQNDIYLNVLFLLNYFAYNTLIVAGYWLSRKTAISYERRIECMQRVVSWEKFDEVSTRRRARSQAGSSCVMKSAWSSRRNMMVEGLILRALDSRAAASARCNLCIVFAIHTRGVRETPRRKPPGYIRRCARFK